MSFYLPQRHRERREKADFYRYNTSIHDSPRRGLGVNPLPPLLAHSKNPYIIRFSKNVLVSYFTRVLEAPVEGLYLAPLSTNYNNDNT